MDSTMTSLDSSNTEVSHLKQITFSSETMLIEESNHLKLFVSYLPTRSNTLRTSSYLEEIMSVPQSTESMDSMMNVREGTTSNFGRLSLTVLTAYQLQPLLTKRSYVCMVVYHLNFQVWSRSEGLWDLLMYQTQDFYVISFGQIQRRTFKDGRRMTEVLVSSSVQTLYRSSLRSMILIWSAEHIK